MTSLGETLLLQLPDEPVVHLLLANAALDSGEGLAIVAPELIAWAETWGESPSRVELVRLCWRLVAFRQRVENELPSPALAAERKQLLRDIANFEPADESEEARAMLLALGVRIICEEDASALAMAIAPRIEEIGDPTTIYPLATGLGPGAEHDPEVRRVQRRLIDILLASDPSSMRYPAYLFLDARARPDEEAKPAIRKLLAEGLPDGVADDAWTRYAWITNRRDLPTDAREALVQVTVDERRHSSTLNAALMLAAEDEARGRRHAALLNLQQVERRFGIREPELAIRKAELLTSLGRHGEALEVLQTSLLAGGVDYSRWYLAARGHQKLGNEPEAVRLYQYYLVQMAERSSGVLPFGKVPSNRAAAEMKVTVWFRIVEMHPAFFGRSGFRQFVELLALLAAGLLAAARASRARAFLLPGALAAEIVFFAGFIALRTVADGTTVPALSWVWLGSASLRTFVLVAGGLYVSALAGLPRHTRSIAGPVVAAGIAALAGLAFGLASPPLFVFEGLPGFARVAELGLAPQQAGEIPALLVSALRFEAASRLVWPALVLTALPTDGLFALPLVRIGRFVPPVRETIAVLVSALLCSAGSPGLFPLAVLGAVLLCIARIRWGAAVPFLLHAAFALCASIAAVSPG